MSLVIDGDRSGSEGGKVFKNFVVQFNLGGLMGNNNTRDGLSIVPYSSFRPEGEFLDSSYMVITG